MGVISIRELKMHMHSLLETSLEKHITNQVLRKYDENSDTMLNFEEFYQMTLINRNNKFQRMVSRYCEIVIPTRTPTDDSNGKLNGITCFI